MAGSSDDPLQSFAVASGAVSKPGGDAAGQDAFHSAGVEGSEDIIFLRYGHNGGFFEAWNHRQREGKIENVCKNTG